MAKHSDEELEELARHLSGRIVRHWLGWTFQAIGGVLVAFVFWGWAVIDPLRARGWSWLAVVGLFVGNFLVGSKLIGWGRKLLRLPSA